MFLFGLALSCTPDPEPNTLDEPSVPTVPTAATGMTPPTADTATPTQKAVLLITIDTFRFDHMGLHGDPRGLTPNLDAFAATSLQYRNAHNHAPWTKPSMASLMTSQLPVEHGVQQWEDVIEVTTPTLATALKGAGFTTEAVVASGAFDPAYNTFHVGYDRFDQSVWQGVGTPTELITSEALTDVALTRLPVLEAAGEPWLLWVHYFDPHDTYFDHDALIDVGPTDVDRYAEEVAYTDLHLGRLLDAVEDREELIVLVLSDHGEELWERGAMGHAHTLYEELAHVLLLMRVPGYDPAIVSQAVPLIDVTPTVLDQLSIPNPDTFRGVSLLPDPTVRPTFMEARRIWDWRGVVDGSRKLVWNLATNTPELYDLALDPLELDNQWDERPEEAARLAALLEAQYPEVVAESQ